MRLATLAWRGLLARPLRAALTAVGIALGVAVVTAAAITAASADAALQGATADLLGRADVRLRAFADAGFTPRAVQALRSHADVAALAPVSERRLVAYTDPGPDERVFSLLVFGVDPDAEAAVRDRNLVAGEPLSEDGGADALVPASWASRNGLAVGDSVRLDGRREGLSPLRIVGLMGDTGFAALEGGEVMVISRSTLDESFSVPAPIRSLDLDLGTGDVSAALERVTEALDEPFIVETPEATADRLASAQASFGTVAFLIGLVAIVVGAFLVGNTLAMTVGERTRELGLLRAAGTTGRQVMGIVVRQAVALGIAGSALGIVLGIGLAAMTIGTLESTRATLVAGLPLPPGGLLLAFALGLGVTLLAAIAPARRAADLAPLEALRPSGQPGLGIVDRLRWLLLAVLAAVLVGVMAFPVERSSTPFVPILLSLGILVAAAVATAFVIEPLAAVVGRPFEWFFGTEGLLGRANLGRDRVRTGLTVGAFMIALATVVALGTVAESARAGAERWVASILPGGHAIRSSVPLDVESFRPSLEATPGLAVASPVHELPAVRVGEHGQEEVALAGIDPNVFADAGALILRDGDRGDAFAALRGGGAVLVPASLAARDSISVGDGLELGAPGAEPQTFSVAGIVEYTLPARTPDGALLISAADARDRFSATAASLWVMAPEPGVASTVFAAAVRDTAGQLGAQPLTARDLAGELSRSLDRLVGLFDALALIAVAIGALGIVNTLGVGVSERVREISILRSHGMTVSQVQAMVVAEAAIMGAIAGVLAVAAGISVSIALVGGGASGDLAADVRLPWPLLGAVVLLGTGVAALAGLYPARIAASLPIVRHLKQFE